MYQLQRHTLRTVTTAHLAQTMTLLAYNSLELQQEIESMLSNNPALEMVRQRQCPVCRKPLQPGEICPVCSRPKEQAIEEPIVYLSPRDDFYSYSGTGTCSDDYSDEPVSAAADDLPTYVLGQISADLQPADRKIAAYLLTNLDEDGFLTIPLMEACIYLHVTMAKVKEVQRMIQHADPLGVGSVDSREAMLLQLEVLAETQVVPEFTAEVIRTGMDMLSRRQYSELAKKLNSTPRKIQRIETFISENLNPFPGRSYWGDVRQPGQSVGEVFRFPDILIGTLNDDPHAQLTVEIVMPIGGFLQINPLYRKAVREAEEKNKEGMREDMDKASLFVKCIQQRNHTMMRLMERVAVLQRDYILYGEQHLKPVTRVMIARELDVHESTISRAVANKLIQLPNRRIVKLSSFFDRNLSVRTVLKEIISKEKKPLSDSVLAELLAERGFEVARRTVAKYRTMEGILPAHLRHNHQKSV